MSSLLDRINSPADLRRLERTQLDELAAEIRTRMIGTVSHTGGHLAASLGAVEIAVALHYILDTPTDKIIWDVGHQAYAHKLLTGRRDRFDTLRQVGGISGFPRRAESDYDAFDTGHGSTSIAAALGMAKARDIENRTNAVVAVVGDGAMTGGM
ncbi:MAG: 1-deoxy-D-xylulose-5-phosphate synthase, partial [Armatimonadetes bacterium]|nr:1-deoxy-D-xylulose-5-phosphate synthase [Armatimonadota bacterium]